MNYPHKEFKERLNMDLRPFIDELMSTASNKWYLDIIKFDRHCHNHLGYSEAEHGSLQDFISEKFGQEAVDLILRLIDGIPLTREGANSHATG